MNNNDPIGRLASRFSLEDLTNTVEVLTSFEGLGLIKDGEVHPDLSMLQQAIKLKAEKVFYVFDRHDDLLGRDGNATDGIGIFKRNGETLERSFNEDMLPTIKETIIILNELGVQHVITGLISGNFLGIPREITLDDNDYNDPNNKVYKDLIWEIHNYPLCEEYKVAMKKAGIVVTELKELI